VEFAQHREYVPGDEIKHVDWKVFARTDRYTIKQYEEETNLRGTVLLDASESMEYGSGPMSKFEYACCVAASLAFLLLQQQDSVGLGLFDSVLRRYLPPSNHPSHMKNLVAALEEARPAGRTGVVPALHELSRQIPRKGMVIVISDFFDDVDGVLSALRELRHRKHEVIALHVLDAWERTFPFRGSTRFEGLEGYPPLLTDPAALRKSYREALDGFIERLRRGCLGSRIEYALLDTSTPLDAALAAYLSRRSRSV
jgi:uncharacterized protein (DUF58 family)